MNVTDAAESRVHYQIGRAQSEHVVPFLNACGTVMVDYSSLEPLPYLP